MSRLAWIAVGAVGATVAVGACAYPNFVFDGSTGTGAQGGAGSTSTGSTGGAACKVTHPGGGSCEYLPGEECGCSAPGQKCTVIDPATGESACLTAGTTQEYGACSSTVDCGKGSWCELSTSVCEPICVNICTNGGSCVPAAQGTMSTATIPGLDVCTVSCNLVTASPCGTGATCINLTSSSTGDTVGTVCIMSGLVPLGMPCSNGSNCGPGLVCVENEVDNATECSQWCSSADDPCPGDCNYFSGPSVDIDMHDYGYCGD
jgi:hypothetical protein